MTGTPVAEYGGLTSVPGPFRCDPATVTLVALQADPRRLADLCSTVLVDPDGRRSYTPLGGFVLLSFGSMTVRSLCTDRSPLFGVPYADMGSSDERHVAVWVPTVAAHRADRVRLVDRIALFVPAMWVDNPVSLVGGREIYGIAKQLGRPVVTAGARPSCSLDVFGGAFGPTASSGWTRLLDLTHREGVHPVEAAEEVAGEVGEAAGDSLDRLLRGELTLPDVSFFHEVGAALVGHQLAQVTRRQFRVPTDDGRSGTPAELVELATTFDRLHVRVLPHGFDFALRSVASHPLGPSLGLTSQTVPFGVEVTASFDLGVA